MQGPDGLTEATLLWPPSALSLFTYKGTQAVYCFPTNPTVAI